MNSSAESLSYDSLAAVDSHGRLIPRLAKSWERSNGGKDWVFAIADRIRFHNGRMATAHDVAALLREAVRNPDDLQLYPGLRDVETIETLDDRRIRLRSRTPRLSLLYELADLYLGRGNPDFATGPFSVSPITEQGFVAKAFKGHFAGAPAIEQVEFRALRSQRSAWAALMRDEIDVLYEVSRDAVEFVERDARVKVYPFLRSYPATLFLNTKTPQLNRPEVRRALALTIDRDTVIRIAYRGRGRPADGPLWPQHWALSGVSPTVQGDRAAVRAMFAGRGTGGGASRLRFRCLLAAGVETQPFERIALVIQRQLFNAGVDMDLELVSPREFMSRLSRGNFEAALFEFAARTPTWVYSFWHSPSPESPAYIRHGYASADAELDAMHLATTEEELGRAVAAVYRRMADDPPAIFLAWPQVTRVVNTRFEVPVETGHDVLGSNLRLWRPAPKRIGAR